MSAWEIAALVAGLLGLKEAVALAVKEIARRRNSRAEAVKVEADAQNIQADTATKTLDNAFRMISKLESRQEQLEKKVCGLEQVNEKLRAYIRVLLDGIDCLHDQIRTQGNQEPVWFPPPMEEDHAPR